MTTQKTEARVNYRLNIIGNLMHDNNLFDSKCSGCGRLYSSYEVTGPCPNCGQAMMPITTQDGKRKMAISEGTIALCFGPKQEEKNDKAIKNRKNGLASLYRFKRFSFADDNGVLALPIDHHRFKKGAQVSITITNHPVVPSGVFQTKKHGNTIEQMLTVYDNQGNDDKVEVLRDAVASNVSVAMGADGKPAPIDMTAVNQKIAQMEAQITALKAAAATPPPAQEVAQEMNAATTGEPDTVVTDDGADPFADAS